MRHLAALLILLGLVSVGLRSTLPAWGTSTLPPGWDSRLDGLNVRYQPATTCTQGCWRLVAARYEDPTESGGNHHLFARLLDAQGQAVAGETVSVAWTGGSVQVPSKAAPEWADVPLWSCYFPDQGQGGGYRAFAGADEGRSDRIEGMGLPYCWHVNFRLTWQWQPSGSTPTPSRTATRPPSATAPAPLNTPSATAPLQHWWFPLLVVSDIEPPFPSPTAAATVTGTLPPTPTPTIPTSPTPAATATPRPLPFTGQVVQTFPNCGLTQVFGVVHDAAGRPLPGTRLRLTWDGPNAPTLYATAGDYVRPETDASGWDFVLAAAPLANRWHVAVVDAAGTPLSPDVPVLTVATCAPGDVNVGKVQFQGRP